MYYENVFWKKDTSNETKEAKLSITNAQLCAKSIDDQHNVRVVITSIPSVTAALKMSGLFLVSTFQIYG